MGTTNRVTLVLLCLLTGIRFHGEDLFSSVKRYRKRGNYQKVVSLYKRIVLSQPIYSPLSRKASLQLLWKKTSPARTPLGLYVDKNGRIYVLQQKKVSVYSFSSRLLREYPFPPRIKEKMKSVERSTVFLRGLRIKEEKNTLLVRSQQISFLLNRRGKLLREYLSFHSIDKKERFRTRGGRLEVYSSGRLKAIIGEVNLWTGYKGEDGVGNIYVVDTSSPYLRIFDSWGRYLESLKPPSFINTLKIWRGNLIFLSRDFKNSTYILEVYSPSRFYFYFGDRNYWYRAGDEIWEIYGEGVSLLEEGKRDEGLEILSSLISSSYPEPNLPLTLANIFRFYGDLEKARVILQKRAEQFPDIPDVWFDLYLLYQERKDIKSAHSFLRKAWRVARSRRNSTWIEVMFRELFDFYQETLYFPYPFPSLEGWKKENLPSYTLSWETFLRDLLPDFSLENIRVAWDEEGNIYFSSYPLKKVVVISPQGKVKDKISLPYPPLGILPRRDKKMWVLTGKPPYFFPLWVKILDEEGREKRETSLSYRYGGGTPEWFYIWEGGNRVFVRASGEILILDEEGKLQGPPLPLERYYNLGSLVFPYLPREGYLYGVGDKPVLFLESPEGVILWVTPMEKEMRYMGYPGPLVSGEVYAFLTRDLKKIIYFSLQNGERIEERDFQPIEGYIRLKMFLLPDLRIGIITDRGLLYLYHPVFDKAGTN